MPFYFLFVVFVCGCTRSDLRRLWRALTLRREEAVHAVCQDFLHDVQQRVRHADDAD